MPSYYSPALIPMTACLLLVACGKSESEATAVDATSASMAVSLAHAEPRMIERAITVSGPVMAWEEMLLGVELSGVRVTALRVEVGQAVRKGEVLLELDHRMLDSELRQTQAVVAQAEATEQLAQSGVARGEALVSKHLISASANDQLRATLVQASAALATARAQRDSAQLRRDFAALRAPDDGVISKRLVQPGQVVSAGVELLRLIRRGRLEWRAEVSEADLPRVKSGAKVLLVGADGVQVVGRVRAITPGVDANTRTATIYADLPKPGTIKVGMFIEGRIIVSESQALMLPAASVVNRDGYSYLFTVNDKGVAARVRVRTGAQEGGQIEILDGVKEGDAVIVRGAGFLSDGDTVRVVTDQPPPIAQQALPISDQKK